MKTATCAFLLSAIACFSLTARAEKVAGQEKDRTPAAAAKSYSGSSIATLVSETVYLKIEGNSARAMYNALKVREVTDRDEDLGDYATIKQGAKYSCMKQTKPNLEYSCQLQFNAAAGN